MVPYVTLCDGFHTIETVFTKEAVNGFRKNFSHIKWQQMQMRLMKATKWSFQLRQRDNSEVANCYGNLAVYLVVSEFQPIMHKKPQLADKKEKTD